MLKITINSRHYYVASSTLLLSQNATRILLSLDTLMQSSAYSNLSVLNFSNSKYYFCFDFLKILRDPSR